MIYVTVFWSGATLMALEIAGSRILAPYFGSSLFVWGSLIGVVLCALTVGYYAGGYAADRYPDLGPLSSVIGAASAMIALIPHISRTVIPVAAEKFSPGVAPVLSAIALFFLPSLLLAMVSPWCVRISLSSVSNAGHVSGRLFALSNLGSIAGTFGTAFWLLPFSGVDSVIRLGAVSLVLLCVTLVVRARPLRAWACILAAFCTAVVGVLQFWPSHIGGKGVVYQQETRYHRLFVVEDGAVRLLRFDNSIQGGMYIDRPFDSPWEYPYYFELAFCLKSDIRDALIVGLGAGTYPKRLHRDHPEVNIDVVEIDEEVCRVASRYFGFEEGPQVRVYVEDGRTFLSRTSKKYDFIVIDAYYADSIPFHLTTVQFYELVLDRLKPGGVAACNIIGALQGPRSALFRSMYATLSSVFSALYVFPVGFTAGTEDELRNIVVFAVNTSGQEALPGGLLPGPEDIAARAEELYNSGRVTVPGFPAIARGLYTGAIAGEGAVILTDDRAPVDYLLRVR